MKFIRLVSATALAVLIFYSCNKSFLERQPQGALKISDVSTAAGIRTLLVGAYGALDGQQNVNGSVNSLGGGNSWACSPDNWVWGSMAGGDAHKGSDAGDQAAMVPVATFTIDPTNALLNDKWRAVYEGINRCNDVLKYMPNATDMKDAEKTLVSAEARFLRAHYYFDLKKLFNQVPYRDETAGPTDYKLANTADIWPKIEADFKFAYDNLPNTQTDIGRANKWAAGAYLAKTYLYQKKYTEAKTVFDAVIAQGVTTNGLKYDLNVNFENNFRPEFEKTNPEAVFVVEMAANTGSGSVANGNQGDMLNHPYGSSPFGCCGFYQPTQDLVNSYRTDAGGLPYLDTYNQTPVKSDLGIPSATAFTPDTVALDPRLDWTVGRRGLPYHDWGLHPGQDWIRDQNFSGPYAPKKMITWKVTQASYKDNASWAPGSAINVFIIRFDDVLLMAAEVEAQLGNLATALTYVNRVRNRMAQHPEAWLYQYQNNANPDGGFSTTTKAANYKVSPYPAGAFTSKDLALKAIYFERKLELAMEGHRFYDLSRWGIAATAINALIAYESQITNDLKGAKFTPGKNEYFPIPQTQIDLTIQNGQKTLTQNPGY
ncbi:MAG: RagB/SusD family nutrient uptake outer membrane protein [Williamsia sp.]|nr:RagB/SusD family nutrient uptake outer membrane protein [Williamsia sp.]